MMQLPCMLTACLVIHLPQMCMSLQVPEWILVLGGAGIVTGLALYGYKVSKCLTLTSHASTGHA
jgi:phosphate/sulfate permease